MPTACLGRRLAFAAPAAALLAAPARGAGAQPGTPPGAPPDAAEAPRVTGADAGDGRTRLTLRAPGTRPVTVTVCRDATVARRAAPSDVRVVGLIGSRAVLVVDTYPSAPAELSRCRAGEEQFLRALTLGPARPAERWRVKLASCRDDIELADPGLAWAADSATLRLSWLLGPTAKGEPEERTVRFDPDGRPRPARP